MSESTANTEGRERIRQRANWRRAASDARNAALAAKDTRPLYLESGFGRIYVSGMHAYRVQRLPGCAQSQRKQGTYELSLTLETLRRVREAFGLTPQDFARCLHPDLLKWSIAAGKSEQRIAAVHARIERKDYLQLPWLDNTGKGRRPFDHQRVMATVAASLDGSAFLCEVGTGKTRAAIEAASYLVRSGALDFALVVVPNRVKSTWVREIGEWSNNLHPVLLAGPIKQRGQVIQQTQARGTVWVCNYEALDKLKAVVARRANGKRLGLIFDEAHKLKNPQAKQSKAAMELARHAVWRLLMTGTPVLQGVHDVWSQWYAVDLGVTFGANYVQFRREFLDENPYTFSLDAKAGTLSECGLRLRRRGLRYRKEDCLDLPPRLYQVSEYEMTKPQRAAYEQMARDLVAVLKNERDEHGKLASASTQLAMILRLSQITSGFLPTEDSSVHIFDPNPKLDGLEEYVRETIRDHQQIVWARYRRDIETICARFADLKPVHIYGGVKQEDADYAMRAFQDGSRRLFIANPQSAGAGVTLTAASIAHYFSQDYSLENRLQSEGRNHRAGSERHRSVTYVDHTCEGTVDNVVREALSAKLEVAEAVVELKAHLEGRGR